MDTIFIEDLRIETVIGIYDWERKIRQTVALDLEMAFDNKKPAASDNIQDTLDYASIAETMREHVAASSCELLEHLAEELATMLTQRFSARPFTLSVTKPLAADKLGCARIGIRIQRNFN